MGKLAERFLAVRERAVASYRRAGNLPGEPRIVCVTKTQPLERIAEVVEAGATEIGENYVQEAIRKDVFSLRQGRDLAVHYIGHMQSNKYNAMLHLFDTIDSSDEDLLEHARTYSPAVPVHTHEFLLEINAGEEPQKTGLTLARVQKLAAESWAGFAVISGFMTVVPLQASTSIRAALYDNVWALMRALVEEHGYSQLRELSMGTSDDFEVALEHGATMIRVGTAIFGTRETGRL